MTDCRMEYFIKMLLINICILITIDDPHNDSAYEYNFSGYVNNIWHNNRVYA